MEGVYNLYRYSYRYYVQGTEEWNTEYILIHTNKDITLNEAKDIIAETKYVNYYHEIDPDSVELLTIEA